MAPFTENPSNKLDCYLTGVAEGYARNRDAGKEEAVFTGTQTGEE